MIHHIVMFRLRGELPEAGRIAAARAFKQDIEALPGVLSEIVRIHVGLNQNPDEQWDICLESQFHTMEDLRRYATSPQHLAVAGALKPYVAERACVDFVRA